MNSLIEWFKNASAIQFCFAIVVLAVFIRFIWDILFGDD